MFTFGGSQSALLTVIIIVTTVNAVNFVDGLDGLAAGVVGIGAAAFFSFSVLLIFVNGQAIFTTAAMLTAALTGACLGFLPHNFWPARIFMGDSGSMFVGLMLSAAATTATTTADPQGFSQADFGPVALLLPLVVPIAILALPFVDLLLAVFRRTRRGRSPFSPDKLHLHHRLLEMGHSHRRAVLLLYFWSALVAFAGVGLSFQHGLWPVVWTLSGFAAVGILASVLPLRRTRPDAGAPRTAR
jgi:UDP-GlcNAc:undecaprenyl-phosphate GlcNAc-1-phosphate transferase